MAELREELGRAPRSSRTYTVAEAASAWLDDGLPGRSERTKTIYKDGLAPLLAKIGHRPLRDLTAPEGPGGAVWPALDQQPPDCPELAGAGAQVHERLGRNVAELIEAPMGRTGRPSKSLSLAQAQELLKAAEGSRWYGYIVLSSSWVEGSKCELAAFGHSGDGKRGRRQVEYGLLTDPAGHPVAVEVFPENSDPESFKTAITRVRTDFGVERLVLRD